MIRLSENKKSQWVATEYKFYFYNNDSKNLTNISNRPVHIDANWKNHWNSIIKNNYLNIKSQKDVDKIYSNKLKEKIFIADGNSMTIEVISKKKKRRIHYANANTFYEFYCGYGIESKDYRDFLKFQEIMNNTFPKN